MTDLPTAIVLASTPGQSPGAIVLRGLSEDDYARVAEDVAASHSGRTLHEYAGHLRRFVEWCDGRGLEPMPANPEAVALYLRQLADEGRTVSTLGVILAAISQAHLAAGFPSPREHAAFKLAWKGLRRRVGAAGGATPNRKAPVMALDVATMVATQPETLAGLRNRALLALGYAGAFRRSELVALEVSDVERVEGRGLRVTVRRSKTDQVGEGATKAIPFGAGEACPVAALSAWLDAAGIVEGPLFRSITRWGQVSSEGLTGRTVAQLVKDAAETIGRDPSRVSGHSLRAGFVTHALASGVSPADVVQTTKHRGMGMIMVYDRRRDVWTGSGL